MVSIVCLMLFIAILIISYTFREISRQRALRSGRAWSVHRFKQLDIQGVPKNGITGLYKIHYVSWMPYSQDFVLFYYQQIWIVNPLYKLKTFMENYLPLRHLAIRGVPSVTGQFARGQFAQKFEILFWKILT